MSFLSSITRASVALPLAVVSSLGAGCGGSSSSASSSASGSSSSGDTKVVAWKPKAGSALSIARRTLDVLAHDPGGARPDWVLYDPKGDQVVFAGDDAGDDRAMKIASSFDVAPPPAPTPPPPSYGSYGYGASNPLLAPTPTPPDDPIVGVTKVDDTNFILDRKEVDKWLADPMMVAKGARVVPSIKAGKPNGFKLYAIRPGSLYAQIGFANGDTITAINGFDLDSPDKALEVYTHVKDAKSLDVSITRRGQDLVLHYSIK